VACPPETDNAPFSAGSLFLFTITETHTRNLTDGTHHHACAHVPLGNNAQRDAVVHGPNTWTAKFATRPVGNAIDISFYMPYTFDWAKHNQSTWQEVIFGQ
jgi:hypothetical protein